MLGGNRCERPSTHRSPAIANMITTGSVRGKCSAWQAGQSRRQPPSISAVGGAAIRAKAMSRMPPEQRFCLGQRRKVIRSDHTLDRNRAKIDDFKIVACLQPIYCILVEAETEPRRSIGKPEEYNFANRAERARLNLRK